MTRKVAAVLISSVAVLALTASPALAQSEPLMRGLGDFPHARATARVLPPDVVERAVVARQTEQATRLNARESSVGDESAAAKIAQLTSSGQEIEWPQIGIGFGVGILLALVLFLGTRLTHIRPLTHR